MRPTKHTARKSGHPPPRRDLLPPRKDPLHLANLVLPRLQRTRPIQYRLVSKTYFLLTIITVERYLWIGKLPYTRVHGQREEMKRQFNRTRQSSFFLFHTFSIILCSYCVYLALSIVAIPQEQAAATIQAGARGYLARKEVKKLKEEKKVGNTDNPLCVRVISESSFSEPAISYF